MTFEQLDFFIAVAEHDTFFDAADALHISQSALSKQIMRMEKELDISLLDRTHRKASLTQAGQYFYKEAKELTLRYRRSLSGLHLYRDADSRAIRLGTLPILAQYSLNVPLQEFRKLHPEIRIHIQEAEDTELLEELGRGHFDLIIARDHMLNPRIHQIFPITEDELIAVLPASHPLACRTSVSLTELKDEKFILMNPYTSVYQCCIREFKKAGVSAHVLRTGRVESIISSVSVYEGIGLLAKKNFEVFHHAAVAAVSLDPPVKLSVVMARKKSGRTSAGITALTAFFRQPDQPPR